MSNNGRVAIVNCKSWNNTGSGISVPAEGADVFLSGNETWGNGRDGIEIRGKDSVLRRLNLPSDVPREALRDVLSEMLAMQKEPVEVRKHHVLKSRLAAWIQQRGRPALATVADLITLASVPMLVEWLRNLSR
jgi:hypothetical protein